MARKLDPQDWMQSPGTKAVIQALSAGGTEVRFVGGCVRDALLGKAIKDIDIATPDPPEKVMEKLAAAGLKAIPTGLAHGTVTALAHGQSFEVTTLREDLACDGRHAEVTFTDDWQADAARRDLTINALSMSPDGQIFDYFSGLKDLKAGRVRFVGDPHQRMREDYLRLLRFFRFHAHYAQGAADPAALAAAAAAAPHLKRLSAERVREEFLRLLAAKDPLPMLQVMADENILTEILPGPIDLDRLAGLMALPGGKAVESDALLRLAALSPANDPAAHGARLKLSNVQRDRLRQIMLPLPAADVVLGSWLYRLGPQAVRDSWLLAWADSPNPKAESQDRAKGLADIEAWQSKTFPLSGADVLALGIAPGPAVGELLREVEDWWVAQNFAPDRSACLSELKRRLTAKRPLAAET